MTTSKTSSSRRIFFTRAGALGLLSMLPGGRRLAAAFTPANDADASAAVYTSLELRPIINAAGTYTHLGGSLMPPEVIKAMDDAAKHYVPIRDLSRGVGRRIAQLTGNDAALVTTGAAGAIFVGTAACIAGDDPTR